MWKKDEEETSKLNMGSRYKTPNLPVWVSCVNGNWGVLFSPNKDLLKSENRLESIALSALETIILFLLFRFQIHYYSSFPMKERDETVLTVDSRSKNINNNYGDDVDENEMTDPLEKAIQTKYIQTANTFQFNQTIVSFQVELGSRGLEWSSTLRLIFQIIFIPIYPSCL